MSKFRVEISILNSVKSFITKTDQVLDNEILILKLIKLFDNEQSLTKFYHRNF